jgi:hypothetical protein
MKPSTLLLIILAIAFGFFVLAGSETVVSVPPPTMVETQLAPGVRDLESNDREEAEGLPVPIVPGTRVSEAKILPPEADPAMIVSPRGVTTLPRPLMARKIALKAPSTSTVRAVSGRLSATVERARDDARLQLEREVTEWLTPDVPTRWKPPAHLINRMIRQTDVHPIEKTYGTVYEATLESDFSPSSRTEFLAAYQRELVTKRLVVLGGSLGFVLVCLGALAGYIRADEATKGYYTGWLRVIAAAGVGASGMAIYHMLT